MARYKLNHRYATQDLGPWDAGTEIELTDNEAAQVERDSPGAITVIADEPAETAEPKSNRAKRGAQSGEPDPAPVVDRP